jgi:protein-S-isoprenylcysteine O-methyltransferase Ste14
MINLFYAIWITWVLSEIILAIFQRSKKSTDDHDKSSLKIIWITIILSIFTGVYLSDTNLKLISGYDRILNYSGLFLILFGLVVRWIAILTLRKSFTVNLAVSEKQKIVRSGIYEHIRHPSYTGSLISFLGLGILFNNWLTLLMIFIPICAAFLYRVKLEESLLIKTFGKQYGDYLKHSWKLIPGIF